MSILKLTLKQEYNVDVIEDVAVNAQGTPLLNRLPTYLPTCLPTYLPTHLPTYLPTSLPTYLVVGGKVRRYEVR